MTGNLHPNSDINYLYLSRCNGGCSIKQMRTLYENRIIAVRQHLLRKKDRKYLIRYIVKSEEEDTIRVGKELLDLQRIANYISKQPKAISKNLNKSKNIKHEEKYKIKKMHGYFRKKLTENDEIHQNENKKLFYDVTF